MEVEQIIAELTARRDGIDQAIKALEGITGDAGTGTGNGISKATGKPKRKYTKRKVQRTMSPDARRRIGLAIRKRWAERKRLARTLDTVRPGHTKAAKGMKPAKAAKPAKAPRKQLSATTRKRMAEAAKLRWSLMPKGAKNLGAAASA